MANPTQDGDDALEESPKEGSKEDAKADILAAARARFKLASEAESDLRNLFLDDLKFSAGEQWEETLKQQRSVDKRPCLVINRLPQFIHQLTNDQRQNRPSIKVDPVDDNGDPEVAEIFQGIVRHIEYASGADIAYDTGFEYGVRIGRGWWRVITDYCDPLSFDQEILIKRIPNPFVVYPDPMSREPDGSDMQYCFLVKDMTKEEFEEQFPNSEMGQTESFSSLGDGAPDWFPNGGIRVAEYFWREMKDVELVLLSDGRTLTREQFKQLEAQLAANGIKEANSRQSQVPVIKWALVNGVEVLDEKEWPGKWIPVVPVIGEELEIDGKRHLAGIVRNAKDPQRMLNYWKSAETEAIALAPRAPFIVAEGQLEGYESQWKQANTKNFAFLQYKLKSLSDGTPAPPPQRQVYEPAVQAITGASMQAAQDIKDTTGIYDASLGMRSNETSGVAIQRRNAQAQTANFHFVDNLTRSIRHTGRILIDLIPKIYDTPRAVRIIGADGEQDIKRVNEVIKEGKDAGKSYNLSTGKYDVVVETGPSFATRRQEAVASMLDFIKAYPGAAQLIGDLLAKNMDWPGATDIAERLKRALPPGIADQEDAQQPLHPQVKAKMDQAMQMVESLTQQLHAAHDALDTKKIELESKERIERMKVQAQLEIAMAQIDQKDGLALMQAQLAELSQRLDHAHALEQAEHAAGLEPVHNAQEEISEGESLPNVTGGASPGLPAGEIQ